MFQDRTRSSPGGLLDADGRALRKVDDEIERLVAAERARLEQLAGLDCRPLPHYRRPVERPFTAEERGRVTILLGGLTSVHDRLIKAVFEGSGYRCENLPTPDVRAFQLGRQYGNIGQCNPAYFTIGSLIGHLQRLESQGLTRQDILDGYVFFTSGTCGPCRFGMYEAEYRLALRNAGFDGFRVLTFQQNDGVKAASGEPGLRLTLDFGMGALNALNVGDVLHDLAHRIRPYEVHQGETDRVLQAVAADLCSMLRDRERFEILARTPAWLSRRLADTGVVKDTLDTLGKIWTHLYGREYRDALRDACDRLNQIELDRTRVKPVVKITGEFWAQTTEGAGNFNMFAFLEQEGAQALVDPVGGWVLYLLHQAKTNAAIRRKLGAARAWWPRALRRRLAGELTFGRRWLLFSLGEAFWTAQYHRIVRALGGLAEPLASQRELARLADPYYHHLARGGEGHLEVGKTIYYTAHHLCHMVLSLKPFGCLPSTQSDGAQSAVASRFKELIFLPIETSGEGELNAHSRVQMALGEAKTIARREFEAALDATGKRLNDIKAYVADHPALGRPFYPVPRRPGVAGVAANFILHVSDLMDGCARMADRPGRS